VTNREPLTWHRSSVHVIKCKHSLPFHKSTQLLRQQLIHSFRITHFIAKKEINNCNCKNVKAQKYEGCYLYLPANNNSHTSRVVLLTEHMELARTAAVCLYKKLLSHVNKTIESNKSKQFPLHSLRLKYIQIYGNAFITSTL